MALPVLVLLPAPGLAVVMERDEDPAVDEPAPEVVQVERVQVAVEDASVQGVEVAVDETLEVSGEESDPELAVDVGDVGDERPAREVDVLARRDAAGQRRANCRTARFSSSSISWSLPFRGDSTPRVVSSGPPVPAGRELITSPGLRTTSLPGLLAQFTCSPTSLIGSPVGVRAIDSGST